MHLYAFQNYYVEVRFSHKFCRVEDINVMESTTALEPYLRDLPMPAYIP